MTYHKKTTIITTCLLSITIVGCLNKPPTVGSSTNPAPRSNFKVSELKDALEADDEAKVEEMIRNGLQCNQPIDRWYQRTPLHLAARAGADKVVALLIRENVATDPKDRDHATPLHVAANYGHIAVVEKLVEASKSELAVPDKQKYMPLHRAIQEPAPPRRTPSIREQLVSCLLAENIDSATIDTMVATARVDDPDVSAWLKWLEHAPGYAAIHLAAKSGPQGVASHILGKGPDMLDNPGGNNLYTPLHLAAKCKQQEIATFLLNQGAAHDIEDRQGRTWLHHATVCPHTVEAGINTLSAVEENFINSPDSNGRTPLHHAVINGHKEVVKFLVEKGADVHARDNYNLAPLFLARKKPDIEAYLQRKGAYEVIPCFQMACGPCCGRLRYYAKNITDSLAPYIGELTPPLYLPKIIKPCELLYNLFCCGFCQHKDSSNGSQDRDTRYRGTSAHTAPPATSTSHQPNDEELRRPLLNEARDGNFAASSGATPE